MRDKELYATIVGIRSPWRVVEVQLPAASEEVRALIGLQAGMRLSCPKCGERWVG